MPEHLAPAVTLGVTDVLDTVTRIFDIDATPAGREIWILCPDPAHEDTTPSAIVNAETGFWTCFSCGRGGDLLGLGSRVLGRSREAVADLLGGGTPEAVVAKIRYLARMHERAPTKAPPAVPAPHEYADGPLVELRRRGFSLTTLRRWDVRYVPSAELEGKDRPFNIYASIGIPIEDRRSKVLAWCYRRTEASPIWQPRYLYTPGAPLNAMWFGRQHHRTPDMPIVIVEGALDAIWCDQCGVPALALLGSRASPQKLAQLGSHYGPVTLLTDHDTAGIAAVMRLGAALGHRIPELRVARYASWMRASDPAELSSVDLEIAIARAQPWVRFANRLAMR